MVDQAVRDDVLAPEMLTMAEVARRLHAHPNSVRRWANQGLLKCYRFGMRGDRRFWSDKVDQFVRPAAEFEHNGNNGHSCANGGNGYANGGNETGNSGDAQGSGDDTPGNSGDAQDSSGEPGNSGDARKGQGKGGK